MHVAVIVALVAFARALFVLTAASATSTVLVVHFQNGSVFSATWDAVQTGTAPASGITRAVGPTPFIASPSTALPTHLPKQPTGNSVASVQSAVPTVHQSSSSAHRLTVTSGAASIHAPTAITPGGKVLSLAYVDASSVTVAEGTRSKTTSAAAISGGSRDHLTLVLIIIAAFLGVLLLVVLVAVSALVYRRRRRLQQHRAARPYTSAWSSDMSAWTSDVSRSQHGLKLDARRLTTEGSEKFSTRTAYDPPSGRCKEDTASCLTLQLKYPGFAID